MRSLLSEIRAMLSINYFYPMVFSLCAQGQLKSGTLAAGRSWRCCQQGKTGRRMSTGCSACFSWKLRENTRTCSSPWSAMARSRWSRFATPFSCLSSSWKIHWVSDNPHLTPLLPSLWGEYFSTSLPRMLWDNLAQVQEKSKKELVLSILPIQVGWRI